MRKQLLKANTILTMDGQRQILRGHGVLIQGETIVAIEPLAQFAGADADLVDLGNVLLMPGLINSHTHTPMSLFRGLAEGYSLLTLDGWYNGIRLWELAMTREMIVPAVQVSCAEMIRTGTTCFNDQYFYLDQVVPAVRQSGMRAALGYGIVEVGDDQAREWAIREADEFLQSLHGEPHMQGWVGPHAFFVDNSVETITKELALADKHDTGFHIHLSTIGEEDEFCLREFGMTAVQKMNALGVFEFPVIAAHCLCIPETDYAMLANASANARFTALICPSSCMRAGKPAAPVRAMLNAGIACALGTDNVTANNSYDLFKEMQVLGKLMSYREGMPNPISAQKIVEMVTIDGAKALRMDDKAGSVAVGKSADLIALDLDEIGFAPRGAQDLYTALVYSVCGLHVTDSMVNGCWLMRERKLLTLNYKAACHELDAAFEELQQRRNL